MASKDEVRPFSFHAPEAELTDLRKRIDATKWPEREQVTDDSQGVQLDTIQKLARYWATEYDWRKAAFPASRRRLGGTRSASPRLGRP